ncbi:endonuclease/exonuclease/phosphatase family protein [Sphingomicrobium sp. XHP0235]|uniref:endonuclease/exonuclease/phosphatase family protein n=1 Tax=Sphingomicrobium aquimarinum TaxID=3133971 RepID=UPI0031FF0D22
MSLRVVSYNIRKAIGTDRRRKPERILDVLDEAKAQVAVLQEADKRVGTRGGAIPPEMLAAHGWRLVPTGQSHEKLLDLVPDHALTRRFLDTLDTRNLGWHGNAILVRDPVHVTNALCVDLPQLEPRGAIVAEVQMGETRVRIIGTHLDLSGLYRRRQVEEILRTVQALGTDMPTIVAADTNEWRASPNTLDAFDEDFACAACGPSYHTRRPLAPLDKIFVDKRLAIADSGVHQTALAKSASDHFPVWAEVRF